MNAVEIEEAVSELAAKPFDLDEFPFAFLAAFGNKDTTIKKLRSGASNRSEVGGVLQRNNIHLAVAEPGRTVETLARLRESPQTAKQKAKFILATDGEQVEAEELGSGEVLSCCYGALGNHFGFFLPLAGISTVAEVKNNPIDIKATGRLNRLYVQLLKDNADWGTAAKRGDLNRFMARLIFCFFAEDTGIFPGGGLFTTTLQRMTEADGSNVRDVMLRLFEAMNTKAKDGAARPGFPPWADGFPYVNGGLFEDDIGCPTFTRTSRAYLLRAGELDWRTINPDIFGSMIQAVADDDERGELGMHYTSVPNIQKVLDPLFLDELREQLEAAGTNGRKLLNLRRRLSRIRVFDPACGSGNFLVIAYIRMREIEEDVMRRRGEALERSAIALTQFHGIEIKSFAAEIARLSLLIAEFQCDVRMIGQKEARALVLPLHETGRIVTGNALRTPWEDVCPPVSASFEEHDLGGPTGRLALEGGGEEWETYVCGNPPYRGSSWQTKSQKSDLESIAGSTVKSWRSLDYVAGWFILAASYANNKSCDYAFVATKTICEGEQVPSLWTFLFSKGFEIGFAHQAFTWANLASHKAGVTVVVVGVTQARRKVKRLYQGADIRTVESISPYLVPGSAVVVSKMMMPLGSKAKMLRGNMPTDGGNFIMTADEARLAIEGQLLPSSLVRPYMGAAEVVNARPRACLWVSSADLDVVEMYPEARRRIENVNQMRKLSSAPTTRATKVPPYRFMQIEGTATTHTIAIPAITSQNREFLPVQLLPSEVILSNKCYALYDADIWNFSMAASRTHLCWIAAVCARMRSDFSYSNTLGWNTFPVPKLAEGNKADLTRCAEDILLAREAHFPATIADLYDPERMPDDLRAAHDRNDETLERIYIGRRFRNDTERLEKLFDMYTKMTAKKDGAEGSAA